MYRWPLDCVPVAGIADGNGRASYVLQANCSNTMSGGNHNGDRQNNTAQSTTGPVATAVLCMPLVETTRKLVAPPAGAPIATLLNANTFAVASHLLAVVKIN